MQSANTIEDQIRQLKRNGLKVADYHKATEVLSDIGYFRLGFYLFALEKSYPCLRERTHQYCEDASFDDAVNLYYFDFDLRLLMMRYLTRIEVAFRSCILNTLTQFYPKDTTWFVNPDVISSDFISQFDRKTYTKEFRRNPIISRHHSKYPKDTYAPASKTLEFMTFGAVLKVYEEIKDDIIKVTVAKKFGVMQVKVFENYLHAIRHLRNSCAHGLVLYDIRLPQRIKRGPAEVSPKDSGTILGIFKVVKFIMSHISGNRSEEMAASVKALYEELCGKSPILKGKILDFTKL